ncbi:hypothetical protein E2C01_058445 [Portunus trituberculatus]|uniref:Uncharacterized protein n=1 Tax=Portunus trituberculatus TaxID=210409 RepID=A0A5B7GZU1_PORTR|nr:hypothetical protein [Portunus trituberculatus]
MEECDSADPTLPGVDAGLVVLLLPSRSPAGPSEPVACEGAEFWPLLFA